MTERGRERQGKRLNEREGGRDKERERERRSVQTDESCQVSRKQIFIKEIKSVLC